jgi:LmbE family N-acetylglucosaminyl deacetylase
MSESKRILVVSAHPDDIEFGAAGSIAKFVKEGWNVTYLIVTRGQKGAYDATVDINEYGKLRESEAREAAKRTGVENVRFLDYVDSEVEYTLELQKDIAREFRRFKPHRLFCMNPNQLSAQGFINHPDHRRVARATLDVSLMAGTTAAIFPELELEEGLPPWRECEEIWLMGPAGGEEIVDVTDTVDIKLDALAAHESQNTSGVLEAIRERLAVRGAESGVAYAESFQVIRRWRAQPAKTPN